MNLTDEIRGLFANSICDSYSAYQIEGIDNKFPAWVVRFSEEFGVAIPYEGKDVNESFASVFLCTEYGIINAEFKYLLLLSNRENSRNEFAEFCSNFADPGKGGVKRQSICKDPISWWKKWKFLIGNSIREKKPYTVLGELVVYDYLLQKGENAEWNGPEASSHDIVCSDAEYEVKSTLSRYGKMIHVTGQFQLQYTGNLFLFFCRFEKNSHGISINEIKEKLIKKQNISSEELDSKLSRLSYAPGNSACDEKYQVHEIIRYEVDDKFPRIVPEMFKAGKFPSGIKQISYDVDLSNLEGINIDFRF